VVYFWGFHAYINEVHGSRSKIFTPSKKKISSGSDARRDLITAFKEFTAAGYTEQTIIHILKKHRQYWSSL
jgi:hypothetical protein